MREPVNMYITLHGDVATILSRVSRRERRNPRDQAALYIEDALRRTGELRDTRGVIAIGSPAAQVPA